LRSLWQYDLYDSTISMCFVIAHTVSNGQSEMQIHAKITYFFSSNIFKFAEYKGMVLYELHSLKTVYIIGSGSGGWISWDQNSIFHEIKFMRSNFLALFMRSKFLIMIWSPDHGNFHEIKIQKSIIRQFWSHDQFVSYKYDHKIKIQKAL
jgi:hypothetical protein